MSTDPDEWLDLLTRDDSETVTVSKASLRHLAEHAKAVEENRDELLRLLMDAQQVMTGPGTTDEKLRKAGRFLGLLNPHRTKEDWDAMADHYWRLRFGVPPLSARELEALKTLPPHLVDQILPREPMSQQDAQMEMEKKYGRTFGSIIKGWQNQNEARRKWNEAHKHQDNAKIRMIEVKTGKRHPTYKDTLPEK